RSVRARVERTSRSPPVSSSTGISPRARGAHLQALWDDGAREDQSARAWSALGEDVPAAADARSVRARVERTLRDLRRPASAPRFPWTASGSLRWGDTKRCLPASQPEPTTRCAGKTGSTGV